MAKLPSDATLISTCGTLTHPRRLATNALAKARQCARGHGNANVRIGVTGTGQKPCYRVSYFDGDGVEQIFGSWWDMGDPLANDDALTYNWSTASIDADALENFVAERVGYSGPRPKR